MSTFIDLDSTYRNITSYPNPASYTVDGNQIRTWYQSPRQVTQNSIRPGNRIVEFSQSVKVVKFILPYGNVTYTDNLGVVHTVNTADLQRIYLDVHSINYNDKQLIYSIDNKFANARFVLTQERIQFSTVTGLPVWVFFFAHMDQVTRFPRNEPVVINIMQEQGYTIVIPDTTPVPNPLAQTYILLEIIPYFRDGEFSNHGAGLTQLL